jgi:hypothetical protein
MGHVASVEPVATFYCRATVPIDQLAASLLPRRPTAVVDSAVR